jgi:putative transposase
MGITAQPACTIQSAMPRFRFHSKRLAVTGSELLVDLVRFLRVAACSRGALVAENLFLRKQLVFYEEHKRQPRRLTDAARISLVFWSRWFNWREVLTIVQPDTLIRWHRKGFQLFWRWKSKPGRPRLPRGIRRLIAQMATENPTWGQARVASELSLKLGIYVSPRTVRAYWPSPPDLQCRRTPSQHWQAFVRNHARAIIACDFLVAVTVRFRVLYVLVIMEVGRRQILWCNVTSHPTAAWALQQFREAVPSDHSYQFLIHDRDSIFSADLDDELKAFGLRVLRTPVRAPKANAYCERLVGSLRRECLDFLIPLSEKHLRMMLHEWVEHYNHGRPHMSLGPGIPSVANRFPTPVVVATERHQWPDDRALRIRPILDGLHHEYYLEKIVA